MNKFKVGDRVKITKEQHSTCNLQKGDVGVIADINTNNAPYVYRVKGLKNWACMGEDDMQLRNKSLDNLEVGDVLVDCARYERTVLAIVGKLVALSQGNRPETHYEWYTVAELKETSYKLKDSEEEITELTLEEVAELKGIPVEKLRIKDK